MPLSRLRDMDAFDAGIPHYAAPESIILKHTPWLRFTAHFSARRAASHAATPFLAPEIYNTREARQHAPARASPAPQTYRDRRF